MTRRSFLTALSLASGTMFSGWRPDGLGYRARIGLLTPNDDAVPESEVWRRKEFPSMLRVFPPHPDDATALLAALPMQAIVLTFTTTSYILGPDGEQALKARLEKRSNGIPVLLTGAAAVAAFRALGVRRIALIHHRGSRTMSNNWELRTFGIRDSMSFTQTKCALGVCRSRSLPIRYASLPSCIPQSFTYSRAEVPATAEAVFFGGNGFRAIGMIAALEE